MKELNFAPSVETTGLIVVYLDFDGVLHHDAVYWSRKDGIHIRAPGATLFEWSHILEQLLAPHPDVRIVLSTSWVRVKSFDFAKKQLLPSLQERVIGATFHRRQMSKFAFDQMSRGAQIYADVQRRRPAAWLALDNDVDKWPTHCLENLIKTEDHLGLNDPSVQLAVRMRLAALSGHQL